MLALNRFNYFNITKLIPTQDELNTRPSIRHLVSHVYRHHCAGQFKHTYTHTHTHTRTQTDCERSQIIKDKYGTRSNSVLLMLDTTIINHRIAFDGVSMDINQKFDYFVIFGVS